MTPAEFMNAIGCGVLLALAAYAWTILFFAGPTFPKRTKS